jgi:hypothetical protein
VVRFEVNLRSVILVYEPEVANASWVSSELRVFGEVTVSRGFTFTREDILEEPAEQSEQPDEEISDPVFRFRFGKVEDGYFRIPGRILGISSDVLIADDIWLERKLFIAERNVGIFRRIAKVKKDDAEIVVGGEREGRIPKAVFDELLAKFPNSGELDRYANARVATIIGEYFDGMKGAREQYEAYLSRRKSSVSNKSLPQQELLQSEIDKFIYVRDTIAAWLKDANAYSERDWQKMIIKVILLIFPKYVAVLENIEIADFYTLPGTTKRRYIDLCLIDAGGSLDVIEIKKPFDDVILTRTLYRDNSLPTRELSGSIMQAEKYLFHLSKWGVAGERDLTAKHASSLPGTMSIRITNPKAMIILGRDCLANGLPALTERQMFDLEVIKRKYANMMDILTYDDLLRRLNNIIASLAAREAAAAAANP